MSTIYGKLGGASAVDTTDRELLAQALEALRFGLHVGFDESSESQIKKGGKAFDQHSKAVAALRERLAQPEHHDPIGDAQDKLLARAYEEGVIDGMQKQMQSSVDKAVNSMTRTWQGLTDEDIFELADTHLYDGGKNYGIIAFARAIEDKLREKNYG